MPVAICEKSFTYMLSLVKYMIDVFLTSVPLLLKDLEPLKILFPRVSLS